MRRGMAWSDAEASVLGPCSHTMDNLESTSSLNLKLWLPVWLSIADLSYYLTAPTPSGDKWRRRPRSKIYYKQITNMYK